MNSIQFVTFPPGGPSPTKRKKNFKVRRTFTFRVFPDPDLMTSPRSQVTDFLFLKGPKCRTPFLSEVYAEFGQHFRLEWAEEDFILFPP